MKVVFNIDDFGYTKSQVDGVIYAYQNGIITSTTTLCVVRDELLEYAAQKSKENPGLGVGVHLTLSVNGGHAVSSGKTICKEDRTFYKQGSVDYDKMDPEEVYQEYKAQIERFIKFFGRKPTHLDHHHGLHIHHACLKQHVVRLAEEYGIPYRFPGNPIDYKGCLYREYTVENAEKLLQEEIDKGTAAIELACHPAFVDQELYELSSYNSERIEEMKTVCNPEYRKWIEEHNIERIHY